MVPLLFPVLYILSGVLFLLVVKDDPFETEGVEKSPFRERSDVFWVDGSDLIGGISLQNDLCILWNLSYLLVGACNCLNHFDLYLEEVVLIDHGVEAIFYQFEFFFIGGGCFYQLQHLFSVCRWDCYTEFE